MCGLRGSNLRCLARGREPAKVNDPPDGVRKEIDWTRNGDSSPLCSPPARLSLIREIIRRITRYRTPSHPECARDNDAACQIGTTRVRQIQVREKEELVSNVINRKLLFFLEKDKAKFIFFAIPSISDTNRKSYIPKLYASECTKERESSRRDQIGRVKFARMKHRCDIPSFEIRSPIGGCGPRLWSTMYDRMRYLFIRSIYT